MDQKASFTMAAAIGMMAILAGFLANVTAPTGDLGFFLFLCGTINAATFATMFTVCIMDALSVYRARGDSMVREGLLFPLHVQKMAGVRGEAYLEAINALDKAKATDEFALQVVALSAVYKVKQEAVNRLVTRMPYLAVSWLGGLLFLAVSAALAKTGV